jgi:uncharacterized protein (DUF488 family)
MADRYPPILCAYKDHLAERVLAGEIVERSARKRLNCAQRLLEACLREVPDDQLTRIHGAWFAERSLPTVISELRRLLTDRPRQRRRSA